MSANSESTESVTASPDRQTRGRWPWTATAGTGRPVWPPVVLVTLVAAALAWVRMPTFVAGQLYAEDGKYFVGQFLGRGWSVLWTPYAGYQHLIPRVATALVADLLPAAWWAVAVNALACLAVGGVAGLVFLFSRDIVTFWPSRLALGFIAVLTPVAGLEAIGNLANLHWFLLYLTPWLLLATPRSTIGASAMAVVAALCTGTEPQCAIFLPLVIWRIVQSRRTWPVAAGWLVGFAAQVITTLISPRAVATHYPPLASTVEGYVLNAGMTLGTTNQVILGRLILGAGWWIGSAGVAAIIAVAVLGAVRGGLMVRVAIASLLWGSVASWAASFVLGSNPALFYSHQTDEQLRGPLLVRWGTAASMLLVATIPVAVGALVQRYPRWRPAGAGLLVAMLLIMAGNLFPAPAPEPPSWWTAVEQTESVCRSKPYATIKVVASPPDWLVLVPCSWLVGSAAG